VLSHARPGALDALPFGPLVDEVGKVVGSAVVFLRGDHVQDGDCLEETFP
jgi:hypothetical protein